VKEYNREWHAVVEHAGLARTMRHHLEQDYEDNRAAAENEALAAVPGVLVGGPFSESMRTPKQFTVFRPLVLDGKMKVQVLLTPDNYPEVVAELISTAKTRVLVENQSFSLWSKIENTPEHFMQIARALKDRQDAGKEVRIIFRSGYGGERETLRQLKKFGLNTGKEYVRFFDKCHTKGIVIDDSVVVLGSHNWTAGGTGPNRDASLIIWNSKANKYFAQIFDYDWDEIAEWKVKPGGSNESVRLAMPGAETPAAAGYRRVSLSEFLGET
jgi:phosphatidylserine/phosphatidylglycerophosphate/cardiolipin synthase-like enzyme